MGTVAQLAAAICVYLQLSGGLTHEHGMTATAFACVFWLIAGWKNDRRRRYRLQRELRYTQDNATWLQNQLHELSKVPPPQPPVLTTLTVQSPRIWGGPVEEEDWPVIPLWVNADSPHDPAATMTGVRLPPGAPWHTSS